MQELAGRGESRPVAIFRTALAEATATERSARRTRTDRVQAVAGLTDDDLVSLADEFEALLRASDDASAMATSLHAALRALSPEVPVGHEVGDA